MNSGGVRGLDVLDIDLVSILGFMGADSSTSVDPSTSILSASTSTSGSLVLGLPPSSIIFTFVKASSILALMDSITVLVLLLKTLYARLVVEYLRKIPSSLFAVFFVPTRKNILLSM